MRPIITSSLDTDLYKMTMQQAVFHQYPNVNVEYEFFVRNREMLGDLAREVQRQVWAMGDIRLTPEDREYLATIRFLKPDYLDFLSNFRFVPQQVQVVDSGGRLAIRIRGRWLDTILWETPLLAVISELRSELLVGQNWFGEAQSRLEEKMRQINAARLPFADMGTRRRFSTEWQRLVVEQLAAACPSMTGTSNVLLAKDIGIKAIGTMAHEWPMAHLGWVDELNQVQKRALHVWLQEYGTDLGIALTDTFGRKAFFADFGPVLARSFSGMRQDSGDPIAFGHEAIAHYQRLGIDPLTKSLIFTDGLDIPAAMRIYGEFVGKVGVSFGIGTNLTHDVGIDPPNMVIKMVSSNGKPVVKISDTRGKVTGDSDLAARILQAYDLG